MAERRLSPDERALWSRVTEDVAPLRGRASSRSAPLTARGGSNLLPIATRPILEPSPPPIRTGSARPGPIGTETLDGGWDRRLRRGAVQPDVTIDLHGHSLASAHLALDHALGRAVASDVRVILLVTGRPPRRDAAGDRPRGLIRASLGDWLAGSRHAGRIAAVRGAHPRHGGAGAVYLVLRRPRSV